jgi:hypothetical protein
VISDLRVNPGALRSTRLVTASKLTVEKKFELYYRQFCRKLVNKKAILCSSVDYKAWPIYRRIVSLGTPAVKFIVPRIKAEDIYLNSALMEILGLSRDEFTAEGEFALSAQLLKHDKVKAELSK